MARVEVDHAELARLLHSAPVLADLERRAQRVRAAAARRAAEVSPGWAKEMDTQAGADELGPYVDVSWRRTHGRGTGGGWRGEFFEFGHDNVPAHPALRPALDEAFKD